MTSHRHDPDRCRDVPADTRELAHLTVRTIWVSAMDNAVYLLTCRATGDQLLVDAADDPERITALVDEGTGRLDHLVTTHRHWDHVRALESVVARTGATTYAGAADADALPVAPGVRVDHGDVITLGDCRLDVIGLRGHTDGGIALHYRDPDGMGHLFSGDSLFPGGVGATRNEPDQSFERLFADVTARIFDVLPDDTAVYPGHGRGTTLGAERPALPAWAARGW